MKRRLVAFGLLAVPLAGCGGGGGGGGSGAASSSGALTLLAATYLGGDDIDSVRDVCIDGAGFVYVVGGTASSNFPVTTGAAQETFGGNNDAYLAKFTPDGSALVFATYLGGPNYDRAYAVEVDANGCAYVAGRAGAGFPTTVGSVQPNFAGDVAPVPKYGPQDGFVTKFAADGSTVLWSTYFGNDENTIVRDLALDGAGNSCVVSAPSRPHWAVTPGAFDTTLGGSDDGLIAKLASDGASVVWGSYFGGSGSDGGTPSVRVAPDDSVWVLGTTQSDDFPVTGGAYQAQRAGGADMLLLHFAADGATLLAATAFGGSNGESSETHGLWIDPIDDSVVFVGATDSTDLPFVAATIPPPFQPKFGGSGGAGAGQGTDYAHDGFVARLAADGTALLAFTYLGGKSGEGVEGVALDASGHVWCSGATYSNGFPLTQHAFQRTRHGKADQFLVGLSSDLSTLWYSSFCGGSDDDEGRTLAVAADGAVIAAGSADSVDYPTTVGAFQSAFGGLPQDACWFKLVP